MPPTPITLKPDNATTLTNDRLLLALEDTWQANLELRETIDRRAEGALAAVPDSARIEPLARMSPCQRARALSEASRALAAVPGTPWDGRSSRAYFRRFLDRDDAELDRAAERLLSESEYYEFERSKSEVDRNRHLIERRIAETPADGLVGLAVKMRIWWHQTGGQASSQATAKGPGGVDEDLLQSIEGDIDRLAG